MKRSATKGTSKYIVGPVERFDERNKISRRHLWDESFRPWVEKYLSAQNPKDKNGYRHEDLAFMEAAWYVHRIFGYGYTGQDDGMYSWEGRPRGFARIPPGLKLDVTDSHVMSRHVKRVARSLEASGVGICELDRQWLYSHCCSFAGEHKELNIPEDFKYAVVMTFEMDYELASTSPAWLATATEGREYSKMAWTSSMVAQFIRGLGYKAISSGNEEGLNVPMAIDAGLGDLGRNGLLITPKFGPRVRIAKVLTNLTLAPDEPIEFGVTEFCEKCRKCAQHCPNQAIL